MFTEVNNKILQFFFRNPTKVTHLRDLARQTKLSPAGALKALRKLEENSLVIREKTTATDNFKANSDSKEFRNLKWIYNLYLIKGSGLIDFLNEKYAFPEAIILFGSYSKGEDIETSDIDLAVITKKELSLDFTKFEKALERKITVQEIDVKKVSKEFLNNLINGIVMDGHFNIK